MTIGALEAKLEPKYRIVVNQKDRLSIVMYGAICVKFPLFSCERAILAEIDVTLSGRMRKFVQPHSFGSHCYQKLDYCIPYYWLRENIG